LGVHEPRADVRHDLDAIAREVADAPAPRLDEQLKARSAELLTMWLDSVEDGAGAGWHHPCLAGRVGFWCLAASDAGADVTVVLAWEPPDVSAAAAPTRAERALLLARWEATYHAAVTELAGTPCVVVAVGRRGKGLTTQSRAILAAALDAAPPEHGEDRADVSRESGPQGSPTRDLPTDVVLTSQRRLGEVLGRLTGVHAALPEIDLPALSAWAEALTAAEGRANETALDAVRAWQHAAAKSEDADVLWRALWQVSEELVDRVVGGVPDGRAAGSGGATDVGKADAR
jgi:hypothetical protein